MKSIKNLNNNAVLCLDGQGREVVAFGKGIGFIKAPAEIPLAKIDRTFYNVTDAYLSVIPEIDEDVMKTAIEIIDYANALRDNRYGANTVLSLADHIQFAVKRQRKGFRMSMNLLYEIENTYPEETEIARHAMKIIQKNMKTALGREEIAGIAIHLLDYMDSSQALQIQKENEQIETYTKILEEQMGVSIRRESYAYNRFVTHVHYLLQRKRSGQMMDGTIMEPLKHLKDEYAEEYALAGELRQVIGAQLSEEERMYLVIHISRLRKSEQ